MSYAAETSKKSYLKNWSYELKLQRSFMSAKCSAALFVIYLSLFLLSLLILIKDYLLESVLLLL